MSAFCPHCLAEVCTLGPQMLQAGWQTGQMAITRVIRPWGKSRFFSALAPQSLVTDNSPKDKEKQR